jgi:hypothetical protein
VLQYVTIVTEENTQRTAAQANARAALQANKVCMLLVQSSARVVALAKSARAQAHILAVVAVLALLLKPGQ